MQSGEGKVKEEGGRRPPSDRKGRERDRGNERERGNAREALLSLLYLKNRFLIVQSFSDFNAPFCFMDP